MKRNDSLTRIARKIPCRFAGLALAMIWPLAVSGAAGADFKTEQCSLAIVSHQAAGAVRICDPKTVRALAADGHVFEQNQMGIASMLAIGPDYIPAEARAWFEKAARDGYAPAQVNLAVMYANGWGVPQNYGTALRWLREATGLGYGRAYYNLGILYMQGRGVKQDYAEALRDFRKGADAGDSGAQTNLAYMYDAGLGVERNQQTAADWYRKAADRGDAMAQNNLADMYLRGEGVAQDDSAAFRLFRQAADQGHTGARIKLGYMYSVGRGTAKDPLTAYAWIAAATAAGDARGRDLLRWLESQLSPADLAHAKDLAHNLRVDSDPQFSAKALLP